MGRTTEYDKRTSWKATSRVRVHIAGVTIICYYHIMLGVYFVNAVILSLKFESVLVIIVEISGIVILDRHTIITIVRNNMCTCCEIGM